MMRPPQLSGSFIMTTVPHFTIAYWCLLIAAFLPLICAWTAKTGLLGKAPLEGRYDNHDPRGWMAKQGGLSARANAAQANSFEALPFFFGAVLAAHQLGANQNWLDGLCIAFIVLRLAYIVAYLADKARLRSNIWSLSFFVNIAILLIGWR
jgi:uncharacterized MAPEG superfamily protein